MSLPAPLLRRMIVESGSAILGLSQVERARAEAAQNETAIVVVWISGIGSKPVNTAARIIFHDELFINLFSSIFMSMCEPLGNGRPFLHTSPSLAESLLFCPHFCAISSQSVCDLSGFHP